MSPYWTTTDLAEAGRAPTFSALLPIALRVINRMPQPVAMVSGPISTGGAGSAEANLRIFAAAIAGLQTVGINVFDQLPFHNAMAALLKKHAAGPDYHMPLLEEFYLPLFESGLVKRIYFLPGWQSSTGARWEHEQCERISIIAEPFPEHILMGVNN